MQAATDLARASSLYATEHSFTAAKYEETVWDRLLPGQAESYRYHLAFELGRVQGIRTGYAAVKRGGIVVCLAPYFIQDYTRDSLQHAWSSPLPAWLEEAAAGQTGLRLLNVGSPVTDSCKLAIARDFHFDPAMIAALHDELMRIGAREGADVIAFKDVLQLDADQLAQPLRNLGFTGVVNRTLASNKIVFTSLDDYLESLDSATRQELQTTRAGRTGVDIREYDGIPPDLESVYRLHLGSGGPEGCRLKKLTPQFFESVAALMPRHCRYVLYRAEGRLVGFNLLLQRGSVLIDKYIGVDPALSRKYGLLDLIWLHNIEMCILEGFHTYQSGEFDQNKFDLGADFERTYVFFRRSDSTPPVFNR